MSHSFLFSLSVIFSLAMSGVVSAAPVSHAKAAEFGLHRVERLVLLKKADGSFLTHLQGMTVEGLAHQNDTDPAFKIVAYQFAAVDNSRRNIEITLTEAGKPITSTVNEGGESVGFPNWPSKDSLTLCEGAMHYLLDHSANDAKLKPYVEQLTQFSISAGKNGQGQDVAVVDLLAGAADPVLKIFVRFDGTVDSVAFVQP